MHGVVEQVFNLPFAISFKAGWKPTPLDHSTPNELANELANESGSRNFLRDEVLSNHQSTNTK